MFSWMEGGEGWWRMDWLWVCQWEGGPKLEPRDGVQEEDGVCVCTPPRRGREEEGERGGWLPWWAARPLSASRRVGPADGEARVCRRSPPAPRTLRS